MNPVRRHLFLQIYLGFVLVTLAAVVVIGGVAHLASQGRDSDLQEPARRLAAMALTDLPAAPPAAATAALSERADALALELALFDATGAPVASSHGAPFASPAARDFEEGVFLGRGGPGLLVHLDDGRWLAARLRDHRGPPAGAFFLWLLGVFVVLALGAYPIARRITRRLERLRAGVDAWGAGDLSRRVPVEGADEVSRLAANFNRAADRIEALVDRRERLLANASHELRSPLARLRMAVELLAELDAPEQRARYHADASRDIAELDALIGEILLASRLDAGAATRPTTPVALGAIVREQAARADATAVVVDDVDLPGDATLLSRLVRNLLANARQHGGAGPVRVTLEARPDGGALLAVEDEGPGVPPDMRDRVFEPFFRLPGRAEGGGGGVGLGLALVREIATLHGGIARCLPRPSGPGTRFEVTFSPPDAAHRAP